MDSHKTATNSHKTTATKQQKQPQKQSSQKIQQQSQKKGSPPSFSLTDDEEKNLDILIKELGSGEQTKENDQKELSAPKEETIELELYKRLVKPTCYLVSWGCDKFNRRFLNSEFKLMSDDQIAMLEGDLSFVLKDSLDKILPEIAKRNPRLVSLILMFTVIYAANTKKIEKIKPTTSEQKKDLKQSVDAPSTHTVEV